MMLAMISSDSPETAPERGQPKSPREIAWNAYLRRCADGDQSGLASLYDESSRYVYGLALRILRDAADAEEVTVDVFSQVWRSAASFTAQRGSVMSWLVTLTRSRSIDRLRTQTAKLRRKEDSLEFQAEFRDAGESPEASAFAVQQRRRIRTALDQLTPEQKELLELAYYGGLSHSELSDRLGQPLGTVKTRIRLGMTKLRELLGDREG